MKSEFVVENKLYLLLSIQYCIWLIEKIPIDNIYTWEKMALQCHLFIRNII